MRTMRLSLVGTVLLALLGGLGVAVVAQDEQEAGPGFDAVYSTGTFEFVDGGHGTYTKVDGVIQERGAFYAYSGEGSDPRTSGNAVIGVDGSWFAEGSPSAEIWVFSAITRIENADGAWEGPVRGISHPMGFTSVGWLAGEGAYECLTLFSRSTFDGTTGVGEDLVFEGDPPPMPVAVE